VPANSGVIAEQKPLTAKGAKDREGREEKQNRNQDLPRAAVKLAGLRMTIVV
jgi:hypothetical protein